jgi:hypothetical protein
VRSTTAILFILLAVTISVLGIVDAKLIDRREIERRYGGAYTAAFSRPGDADAAMYYAPTGSYVFVGGQNGTWFQKGQSPKLYQVSLQNNAYVQLDPVRSGGTVWGGGFNGSQLLVSGWGSDDSSFGPYVWLYNGAHVITAGSLDQYGQASSWSGGDIFAASYNGKEWLLTGLGSGPLPSFNNGSVNHMSLGTFNGRAFTDLSYLVPDQEDAILYANAWNGQYWLVGGGYLSDGVLFTFDGNRTVDLTAQAGNAISNFASVQSIAWNGDYWLIGGIGFLAKYDGHNFVDLTPLLERQLSNTNFHSVNAIAWNGQSWMIGGGTPIAQLTPSHAWLAAYSPAGFVNLSSELPSYVTNGTQSSSILTITSANGLWILGGYSGNHGILLTYKEGLLTDYSDLVLGLTYVDWVSSPHFASDEIWAEGSLTSCALNSRLPCR